MSKNDDQAREPDVRINLSLFREEYPSLTVELLRLRKGSPRTNRLASLASIGLMAEQQVFAKPISQVQMLAPGQVSSVDSEKVDARTAAGYEPRLSASQLAQLTGEDDG